MSEIPLGWDTTTLDSIGDLYCGQSPPATDVNDKGEGTPYVSGPHQWNGTSVRANKWTTNPRRTVPPGCIFITVKGAGVGTIFPGPACAIGRDIYAFKPSEPISREFAYYAIKHTIDAVIRQASGLIPGLSREHLTGHEISLPPLAEQHRIVAKLDVLLARVIACQQRLDKIPKLLARLRQSVLAAAFSGRLTASWRESISISDHGENSGIPAESPPGWREVCIGDVIEDLKYGTSQKCFYQKRGSPVLRIPNILAGRVDHSDLKYAELPDRELNQLSLRAGDILLIRSNGSVTLVGKSAVVTDSESGFAYAGYLIRIRVRGELVHPDFLNLVLETSSIRDQIELTARSTSGVNNINSEEVKGLRFALPPIEEQFEIMRCVNDLSNLSDRLRIRFAKAVTFTDSLLPVLLARSFRGELVPTESELAAAENRPYESAQELLRRLKEVNPKMKKAVEVSSRSRSVEPVLTDPRTQLLDLIKARFRDQPFTFDSLWVGIVDGNYEEVKSALFLLVRPASGPAALTMYFNEDKQMMEFLVKKQ